MECPGRLCEPRRTTQGTDCLGHSRSSASVDPPLHCRDPAAPGGASRLPDRLTFYGFPPPRLLSPPNRTFLSREVRELVPPGLSWASKMSSYRKKGTICTISLLLMVRKTKEMARTEGRGEYNSCGNSGYNKK